MHTWQFFVPFLGWLSDPARWLSDLQLGDKKVTLNHLVSNLFIFAIWLGKFVTLLSCIASGWIKNSKWSTATKSMPSIEGFASKFYSVSVGNEPYAIKRSGCLFETVVSFFSTSRSVRLWSRDWQEETKRNRQIRWLTFCLALGTP